MPYNYINEASEPLPDGSVPGPEGEIYFASHKPDELKSIELKAKDKAEEITLLLKGALNNGEWHSDYREAFGKVLKQAMVLTNATKNAVGVLRELGRLEASFINQFGPSFHKVTLRKLLMVCLPWVIAFSTVCIITSNPVLQPRFREYGIGVDTLNSIAAWSALEGAAICGIWVSFAIIGQRMRTLEKVLFPDRDLLSPMHRVILVMILSTFFAGIWKITGGEFLGMKGELIGSDILRSALVGFLFGVLQHVLVDVLIPISQAFLAFLKGFVTGKTSE